jgi:hypothetical protein
MSTITSFLSLSLIGLSFMLPSSQEKNVAEQASSQDVSEVKLRIVPINVSPESKHESYQVCNKPLFKILVTNNSNSQIWVLTLDFYYQNRPRLYKDGKLVPYRADIAKLLESKDRDPHPVSISGGVLNPAATEELDALRLIDWYEPLLPGSYKLINRHRFAIGGAWTNDSEALLFELLEQEC